MLKVLNTPIVPTANLLWDKASKTKGMFARPVVNLFSDITIAKHFTLQTLEGPQQVKDDLVFCMGTAKSDPWMQPWKDIIQTYDLEGLTPDGWMFFIPKPGNSVFCRQVTIAADGFQIYAASGHEVWPDGPDNPSKFIQSGSIGDYICFDGKDRYWIVKKEIFDATYTLTINDNTTQTV